MILNNTTQALRGYRKVGVKKIEIDKNWRMKESRNWDFITGLGVCAISIFLVIGDFTQIRYSLQRIEYLRNPPIFQTILNRLYVWRMDMWCKWLWLWISCIMVKTNPWAWILSLTAHNCVYQVSTLYGSTEKADDLKNAKLSNSNHFSNVPFLLLAYIKR